jgi:sugar phosphate isomerase/epimerase
VAAAVTVSLVPQAQGGPFVFWGDLAGACRQAASLGFQGIEIFAPSAESLQALPLRALLDEHALRLAALGTGAGWLLNGWSLSDPSSQVRQNALEFVRRIIDVAGPFGASAIVGSMQGRAADRQHLSGTRNRLAESLQRLGEHAQSYGVPVLYEPLNRYETNVCNTLEQAVELVEPLANVCLLADLFHMNIEETDVADALCRAGQWIGHLHFVDSNRQAAGCGHLDYGPVVRALREIGFAGWLSAEALAVPDSNTAAEQTIETFRRYFGSET